MVHTRYSDTEPHNCGFQWNLINLETEITRQVCCLKMSLATGYITRHLEQYRTYSELTHTETENTSVLHSILLFFLKLITLSCNFIPDFIFTPYRPL